jgi:hypothetical protein
MMRHAGPKWWALLGAKGLLLLGLHLLLMIWVGGHYPGGRLGIDLQYSFAVMGTDMCVFVVGFFLWLDQKYRCRTCIRRLRMPLARGSFSRATIFSPPSLEWICTFGHGTMREHGASLGGPMGSEWIKNDDNFWAAFEESWKKS